MKDFTFFYTVDDNPAEYPAEKQWKSENDTVHLERGLYLHVDLALPDINESRELRVEITSSRGIGKLTGVYDSSKIALFRDGDRLHLKPVLLSELVGQDYKLDAEEPDKLMMTLFVENMQYKSCVLTLTGPWPPEPKSYEECFKEFKESSELQDQLAMINASPGWHNFKNRLEEMVARCRVGDLRKSMGLMRNRPRLHTIIVGNPGTGKSSCVPFMAGIYKELGLLTTDQSWVTRVSKLASTSINGEYENTMSAIESAQGGTLVFECAGDLYKTETKNYDSEHRIVRALIDALEDVQRFPKWMLVLIGDPEGMESLMAANPDLKKYFSEPIYMEDFTPDELFWMVDACCKGRNLKLTPEARAKLEMYILHQYNHRGPGFQNAWMVQRLFDNQIIPAMYRRLQIIDKPTAELLETVEAQDIPMVNSIAGAGMAELDELIGLGKIKSKVKDYLNAVKLAGRRMEMGLPTNMPRLHMAFLGNPGTGKTTVAEIIGKVFASWGILSGGRVIRTEKSQMVGQYIGETELKMRTLLDRARGNILFIDEAYQLVEGGDKDYGRIVMNSLLTELGKENPDMVVILAGYTAPMKQLLESNEGIESRFPNVFNFEDYTTEELLEIAKLMVRKQGFVLTDGAADKLRTIISQEAEKPSPRFGNGRFVSNLLQNEVLATLGARTSKIESPTREELSTILPEDVVIGKSQKDAIFDDAAIDAALERLDALSGLAGVKAAVHNFVDSARYLHSIGEPYVGTGLLSWRFVGRSGTGKSTVAEIMACILKGMRLISNSHITEIKGERIFNVSETDCEEVIRQAVKKACNGLIFIDVDSPRFTETGPFYSRSVELIRLKVKEQTIEVGGECALILAELEAPNGDVAEQLSDAGVYEFDHTLVFKDFTTDELYEILCKCLEKFKVSFTPAAEKHIREYLKALHSSINATARTMKLISRAIYQQVILREARLSHRPDSHQVQLDDVSTFVWDGKKGKIGF